MIGRRAWFFVGAALVCLALVPLADPGHRWVAVVTGLAYVVLAGCSALDRRSRRRRPVRRPTRIDGAAPWPAS